MRHPRASHAGAFFCSRHVSQCVRWQVSLRGSLSPPGVPLGALHRDRSAGGPAWFARHARRWGSARVHWSRSRPCSTRASVLALLRVLRVDGPQVGQLNCSSSRPPEMFRVPGWFTHAARNALQEVLRVLNEGGCRPWWRVLLSLARGAPPRVGGGGLIVPPSGGSALPAVVDRWPLRTAAVAADTRDGICRVQPAPLENPRCCLFSVAAASRGIFRRWLGLLLSLLLRSPLQLLLQWLVRALRLLPRLLPLRLPQRLRYPPPRRARPSSPPGSCVAVESAVDSSLPDSELIH